MSENKTVQEKTVSFSSSNKIKHHHLERLAIVYIRQSSIQQVSNNIESTQLQYNLKYRAENLGWSKQRVITIDEDLGRSASTVEGRSGFQRLVAEVGLNHVGIIFGIEMSRLARSCKDWHQLLEICAMFRTLISDLDGVYDPSDYNDRLLLGLKGTMSEAELHLIKQRLYQGKLNKAKRGKLLHNLPIGYIRRPNGEVGLDPDEQVQRVVKLIFEKFSQYGTINAVLQYLSANNVEIGIHLNSGIEKGDLVWRRPNRMTLRDLLHHPIYAGAYSYGRRQIDPRCKKAGRPSTGKVVMKQGDWLVLIKDHFPAYISWEQYMANQKQLESNQNRAQALGAIRPGSSILSGLVVCGRCKQKMSVRYSSTDNRLSYVCSRLYMNYGKEICQSLSGQVLNDYVVEQLLKVLEPASLELSLQAAENLELERQELEKIFEQKLERASYQAQRAGRAYKLVEPENRLVARQLEKEWEEALILCKEIQEQYERFKNEKCKVLSQEQKEEIKELTNSIPKIWHSSSTSNLDKKAIVRQLIEKVEVNVMAESEKVKVIIYWQENSQTQSTIIRPVAKFQQMSQFNELKLRLQQLVKENCSSKEIAELINKEGFRPPKRTKYFTKEMVRKLLVDLSLTSSHRAKEYCKDKLQENEWWLPELAKELTMPHVTLFNWIYKGRVKARQLDGSKGLWVIWADEQELIRLKNLRSLPKGHWARKHWFAATNINKES